MFRNKFLKVMILTFYAHVYVFDADDGLRLQKRVVRINYLTMEIVLEPKTPIIHIDWNIFQSASRVMWNVLC
jgi:hypothetical protein